MRRKPLPFTRRLVLHIVRRRPLTPEEVLRPHERLWLLAAGVGLFALLLSAATVWALSRPY